MQHDVPKLPYEWWLKPAGNVVALVVMTTRNLADAVDPQRYAVYARNKAIRKGWIPWNYAEVKAYAPWVVGQLTEAEWLVRREELLQERRTKHEAESSKYRQAWQTQDEHEAMKTQKAMTAALEGFKQAVDEVRAPAKVTAPRAKKIESDG